MKAVYQEGLCMPYKLKSLDLICGSEVLETILGGGGLGSSGVMSQTPLRI